MKSVLNRLSLSLILIFSLYYTASAQEDIAYERVYLSGKDISSPVIWDFKVSEGQNSQVWSKIKV
ncbi:MAG: hypothetical protein ACJAWX_000480, partial [Algoriphagus sp.]